MSTDNSSFDGLARALGSEYEIVRELGRGGASVVYLARDRVLGREVAVKVIRDSHSADPEALARFEREARTLASLQHPNIVLLYSAKQLPGGSLALVMQHGEWTTLKTLVREHGPMPIEGVRQVLRDVAEALIYLHRHQIIHRDIKPENIFIEAQGGRALISDFGIARSGDAGSSVTLTGVVIGTPAYMSPEQIDGGELSGRSDLYSLGMVGYEMLTGERPWDGESLFGVIYKQKTENLPPLSERRPEVPEELQQLIERATAKAPEARIASAEEFLALLGGAGDSAAEREWTPPTTIVPVQPAPLVEFPTLEIDQSKLPELVRTHAELPVPHSRGGNRWMAAAVIALLLTGGAGALAFSGKDTGAVPPAAGDEMRGSVNLLAGEPEAETRGSLFSESPTYAFGAQADSAPEVTPAPPPEREAPTPAARPTSAPVERREPTSTRPISEPDAQTQTAAQDEPELEEEERRRSAPRALLPALTIAQTTGTEPVRAGRNVVDETLSSRDSETRAPRLRNQSRIEEMLAERYPSDLRTRGVGGTAVVTVLVAPNGSVEQSSIVSSSGNSRLDDAAMKIADRMQFQHPQGFAPRSVWVSVPLTFTPQ